MFKCMTDRPELLKYSIGWNVRLWLRLCLGEMVRRGNFRC